MISSTMLRLIQMIQLTIEMVGQWSVPESEQSLDLATPISRKYLSKNLQREEVMGGGLLMQNIVFRIFVVFLGFSGVHAGREAVTSAASLSHPKPSTQASVKEFSGFIGPSVLLDQAPFGLLRSYVFHMCNSVRVSGQWIMSR